MKHYPLEVYNAGHDEYIVMSKGHHDPDEFMAAVRAQGYDWPLGNPVHKWVKCVPDSTGDYSHIYVFVKQGTRGAFPATFACEAYGDEQYQGKAGAA
ncbi:hypothetical protein [Arsukibacterium indicum]|uniref:Uncharacterized protein n=1 Tax=Arsukibacterium indicum TaxID=2848612 RepID=A0ABS6MHE4_9GAMM|nr:hypothetical protein [Arsukibacterium indicum]MBV2128204.1 hypothetical protein [Arsukibacterium indicum]